MLSAAASRADRPGQGHAVLHRRQQDLPTPLAVALGGEVSPDCGDPAAPICGAVMALSRAHEVLEHQATAHSTAGILSGDAHRPRSLAVVAAGSPLVLVAGLLFGALVGRAPGWRTAMRVLVVLGCWPCWPAPSPC